MTSISNKLASPLLVALASWGTLAHAVQDLPGGPAVNQLNLHPPVTKIAEAQHELHWMLMIICTVIFIGVFGVMFYSIWHHRKSRGAKAANFHESTAVEITWTVIPFLIVIAMAAPATKVIVAQKDTTNAELTIKVTGYQWKWGYDYLTGEGEGIGFLSTLDSSQRALSSAGTPQGDNYLLKVDNPLVVPVNKKVRIITTANDVIHSWMVPSFGVKQDAIPGFVRDTWFRAEQVGDYYGQCVELCGKEHAYMPIHVKVLPQDEYTAWVEQEQKRQAALADDPNKQWTLAELVARNTGSQPYTAGGALHSYFQVSDVEHVSIYGLDGTEYIDKVASGAHMRQVGALTIAGEVDRIYLDSTATCTIDDPQLSRRIQVSKANSHTTVVWNPGAEKARAMADCADDEYRDFVCVETANAVDDVYVLAPGGEQRLSLTIALAERYSA